MSFLPAMLCSDSYEFMEPSNDARYDADIMQDVAFDAAHGRHGAGDGRGVCRARFRPRAPMTALTSWLQALWPEAQQPASRARRSSGDARARARSVAARSRDSRPAGKAAARQPEFVQTPAEYLRESTFAGSPRRARSSPRNTAPRSTRIEREFGVRRQVLLAIWGRETDFGRYKLPHDAHARAGDAGLYRPPQGYVPQRIPARAEDAAGRRARVPSMRSSWGGAMGLTQFLPSEFYKYARRFRWRRPRRHLEFGSGCAGLGGQAACRQGLAARQALGLSRCARRRRSIAPSPSPSHVMPIGEWLKRGYVPAYGRKLDGARAAERGVAAAAGGHLWPGVPDAEELLRHQGLQFLRSLCAVRRPSQRPHPRRAAVRDAVEQERAAAHRRRSRRCSGRSTARGLYSDKIDGKAGMLTRAALGAYQKANRSEARLLADATTAPPYGRRESRKNENGRHSGRPSSCWFEVAQSQTRTRRRTQP